MFAMKQPRKLSNQETQRFENFRIQAPKSKGEPDERSYVSIELHQDMFIQRQIYSKSYAAQTGQP